MVDTRYLQDLLAILKTHQVKHIKMQGLELDFHVEHRQQKSQDFSPGLNAGAIGEDDNIENITEAFKKQEDALPPDLRADTLMDQDKILNWSSPDQAPDQPELPLTGEQPL